MTYKTWMLLGAVVLPLTLPAQVTGGRARVSPLPSANNEFTPPPMPSAKDYEKGTAAAVLLDKKKKLALTDSQVTALEQMRKANAEASAAEFASWDSVRAEILTAGRLTEPEEARARNQRMGQLLRTLRGRDQQARTAALALLSDEQKPKAQEYWEDEDKDNAKWMQRGGRPGGGAGGGGGQRPPA